LFTSERPGNPPKDRRYDQVSKHQVEDWIAFMKTKGIKHVLVLLENDDLENYPDGGLFELYKEGGLVPHHTRMGVEDAYENIMNILRNVEALNEKAVTHCTGGTGRAGRVAAAWLSTRHNLTPEDATDETVKEALDYGVQRLGDVEKLRKWMDGNER